MSKNTLKNITYCIFKKQFDGAIENTIVNGVKHACFPHKIDDKCVELRGITWHTHAVQNVLSLSHYQDHQYAWVWDAALKRSKEHEEVWEKNALF